MACASTCGNCRFAHNSPDPGQAPKIPPAPKPHWLWGGEDSFDRYLRMGPIRIWEERLERHRDFIICRRFPEEIQKRKTDTCGEFSE